MSLSTPDKSAFRKETRERIRALDADYIRESDAAVCAKLLQLQEFQEAKRVFAYFSVGREVDTRLFIAKALGMNKQIFLPVVLGDGIMEFALYEAEESLSDGKLRIPEPDANARRAEPEAGDLLLVPALCYDAQKYRMGQGGGYYDRCLARSKACSVGLGRDALLSEAVPREEYDLPVDILITESRILY